MGWGLGHVGASVQLRGGAILGRGERNRGWVRVVCGCSRCSPRP
ncbi:hypothetical protein STRTUCAR8_07093 [Streptomyces turgidiscabies Car8]|uniref:Uncharacterized protein n=1 Tax=Streptomyces turgidiscabies (strain Car8) TaxID=698760 RepID=L7ERN7_STRT8|nr:hypothetical protein STRTUCAR8_07093 [Streptomyces turgidiscabies Car8]